jgi:hypothetical protein
LVGIDCNLSLAKQTIENLCGSSAGAFELWEAVEELNHEHSNYFAGECWRRAPFREVFWCQGKKPPELAMPLRLTDSACGISHNPLKLVGVGQVGKAGLAGMRLARDLRACGAAIWPFDGARECIKAPMVLVEIYPRLFAGQRRKLDDLRHLQAALRSQASVLSARAASPELDEHSCDALVGAAGMRQVAESSGLPEPRQLPERARIEGWIYGVAG